MLLKYYTNGTPSPVLLKQLSQSLQADKLLIIPTKPLPLLPFRLTKTIWIFSLTEK